MNKILTISIAAYNVEEYIKETLDSLCDKEVISDLEIFVVDDGGKDKTLEIAKEYSSRYPNSIIPVHKENGGWGSTVNYSIMHASGKYFRLLDGDDYFEPEGLKSLVKVLKTSDADVIYTPYRRFDDESGKTIEKFYSADTSLIGKKCMIGDCAHTDYVMHACTFKTEILKKNHVSVLEHCFYTDNEYRTKAIAYSKTAYLTDYYVYQYRIGREGQSVDISGLKKHYTDNLRVLRELIRFYKELPSGNNNELIFEYVKSVIAFHYNTLILLNNKSEIREFDLEVASFGEEYYGTNDKLLIALRKRDFSNLGTVSFIRRKRAGLSNKIKMIINK